MSALGLDIRQRGGEEGFRGLAVDRHGPARGVVTLARRCKVHTRRSYHGFAVGGLIVRQFDRYIRDRLALAELKPILRHNTPDLRLRIIDEGTSGSRCGAARGTVAASKAQSNIVIRLDISHNRHIFWGMAPET